MEAEQSDHDTMIRLQGQVVALGVAIEAHNIASVERDTRIEAGVAKINGKVADHERRLAPLESDRSIWNWVIRGFVVGTPIMVIVANYASSK